MGQLTIDNEAEGRVPMELGSPANKVQKVGMPSTSGEPSQTNVAKTIDLTQVSSDEQMEDDTGFQVAVAVKQEVTDDYGDDDVFRGLRNCDSDENDDVPPHFTPPESSDSDREDSVLDEDIMELEHVFDQQRDRHKVQVKSEPDTKDTGDQGTHQTSLDTLESIETPLSMEGTEEQFTLPSSEETLEAVHLNRVKGVKI